MGSRLTGSSALVSRCPVSTAGGLEVAANPDFLRRDVGRKKKTQFSWCGGVLSSRKGAREEKYRRYAPAAAPLRITSPKPALQNIAAQILVLHDISQHLAHVVGIDGDLLAFLFGRSEAQLIEHALHDRMQPARSDVFRALVHTEGEACHLFQSFVGELQFHAFGLE